MNRARLASRLSRMSKLLMLNAPRTVILSEMRMVQDAFIDCEQHGYESEVTNNAINSQIFSELAALEKEHETHMDGKPDPDCDFCALDEARLEDMLKPKPPEEEKP